MFIRIRISQPSTWSRNRFLTVSIRHTIWIFPDISGCHLYRTEIIWYATDDHCVWRIYDTTRRPCISKWNHFEYSLTPIVRWWKRTVNIKQCAWLVISAREFLSFISGNSHNSAIVETLWFTFHFNFSIFCSIDDTPEAKRDAIIKDSEAYGILMTSISVFQFVMGIFCIDLFNYTAMYVWYDFSGMKFFHQFIYILCRKQISRIRIKYFSSMVRQEVGWFDCATSESNVAVRISE